MTKTDGCTFSEGSNRAASPAHCHVRYGSITDIIRSGFYVRFTPNTGHKTPNSRHRKFHVCFTPKSGHSRQAHQCPLIANNGHSAKANKPLAIKPMYGVDLQNAMALTGIIRRGPHFGLFAQIGSRCPAGAPRQHRQHNADGDSGEYFFVRDETPGNRQ